MDYKKASPRAVFSKWTKKNAQMHKYTISLNYQITIGGFIPFMYLKEKSMARCEDFYRKWEKEPNWCKKCEASVSNIEKFIKITKKLKDCGASPKFMYLKLTENVAIPSFRHVSEKELDEILPKMVLLINDPTVEKITKDQISAIITQANGINTKVFDSPDDRFDSPRKIGKKKVKCPECGCVFEPSKKDMKTGRKKFESEIN